MNEHVCPWWMSYIIDNCIRDNIQKPKKILEKYIKPGMTIIDIGCGRGFFSIPAAKLLKEGEIFSIDLQPQMLNLLEKRAKKAKVDNLIKTVLCTTDDLCINTQADFAIACYVIHETSSQEKIFSQLKSNMKTSADLLFIEPKGHVTKADFEKSIKIAENEGFKCIDRPKFKFSHSALLKSL